MAMPQETIRSKGGRPRTNLYIGVYFVKSIDKYVGRVSTKFGARHAGYHDREIDAAHAYDAKVFQLLGPQARLNFPENFVGRDWDEAAAMVLLTTPNKRGRPASTSRKEPVAPRPAMPAPVAHAPVTRVPAPSTPSSQPPVKRRLDHPMPMKAKPSQRLSRGWRFLAMESIAGTLGGLDEGQLSRVTTWMNGRFGEKTIEARP
jgi:hypothetical protein